MKLEYSKPEIVFESFAVSTNIAGTCTIIVDTHSTGNCGIDIPGVGTVFVTGMQACSGDNGFPVDDNNPNDGLIGAESFDGTCYHVPTAGENHFSS